MPANLMRRHNTWYAVLNVPRPQRAAVGRKEFVATLGTTNLSEANARKWEALRLLQARIDAAVSGSPERLAVAEALRWRPSLRAPSAPEDTEGALSFVHDRAHDIAQSEGVALGRRVMRTATAPGVFLIDLLPTFLKEQDHLRERTRHEYEAAVKEFLKWHGNENATEQEITRTRAGAYIGSLKGQNARGTVQRKVSALSAFWTWMMERGLIENNPLLNHWRGTGVGKKSKRAEEDPRRRWNDAELTLILTADWSTLSEFGEAIPALIRFALLSGVRLGEICEWKADMVERDEYGLWINNQQGKTKAARRRFPVHPVAVPLVERLAASPDKEGYLLHDLPRSGYDKTRSGTVAKAFGRAIRKLGIDDPKVVFHTLRNTFIAYMEKAHAPPNAVKLMVAHERADMTYGRYSKGDLVELQEVIATLRYSEPIMALLAS
jgi:integrase